MFRFAAFATIVFSLDAFAVGQEPAGALENLPAHAIARIGTARFRHADGISSLAFSSDGKRITAATMWYDTAVWDAATGRAHAFRGMSHQDWLFRANVSPDGTLLVGRISGGDLGVRDALSGKLLHRFPLTGKMEYTEGHVTSPDHRWLAATDREGKLFLWDLKSGKLIHQIQTKKWDVWDGFHQAFTPDGAIFIQARQDDITFWNTTTGEVIRRIPADNEDEFSKDYVNDVVVSPAGALLAVRIRGRIELREIKTGRLIHKLDEKYSDAGPVFSPDGEQLASSHDRGGIHFWNVETGKLIRTWELPREQNAESLAFSPDGKRLALGCSDHTLRVWDVATAQEISPIGSQLGGRLSVQLLADGKTLLVQCEYPDNFRYGTIDERLSYWDLQGNLLREATLDPDRTHAHGFTSDGRIVAYGEGPHFGFMRRPTPNRYLRSTLRLVDVATREQIGREEGLPCQIHDFKFSADNRILLVNGFNAGDDPDGFGHDEILQIWKRKSPGDLEKVADLPMRHFLADYCLSPDSRWVVVAGEKGNQFHDCETGRLLRSYPDRPGEVVAVSPDGRLLVSCEDKDGKGDDSVTVWEQATGKTIYELKGESDLTAWKPLTFSPDGRVIAGRLDGANIGLWDAFTGEQVGQLPGHRGGIRSLCFSPDGRTLISAALDTTVLIWDWRAALPKPKEQAHLSAERLEQLWQELQAADPPVAQRVIAELARSPQQAIQLLKTKKSSDRSLEQAQFKQWTTDLESSRVDVRETARKALSQAGERAEFALLQALVRTGSVAARGLIRQILERLPFCSPHSSTLATLRSLQLLELLGTPEARSLVEQLAANDNDPVQRREAKFSLQRLHDKRP